MTIYYFGIYDTSGGMESYAKTLIGSVTERRKDIKFHLIVTSQNFSYRSYFESIGCEITVLPNPHKHPVKFYNKLLEILRKADKDSIFQINAASFRNTPLFLAAKRSKIKCVVVAHNSQITSGGLKFLHTFNKKRFKNLGTFVGVSKEANDFMFDSNSKTTVIPNGIDSEQYSFNEQKREHIRNEYGIGPNETVLGQIGRICPQKNQIFAIKVFEKLHAKYPNLKLVFVGKEIDSKPKQYAVRKKLVGNGIIFANEIKQGLSSFYSAIDISILPSIDEGCVLALLESLASGLPMFASANIPPFVGLPYISIELDEDKWVKELSKAIDDIQNGKINRSNKIKETNYTLAKFSDAYIDLYKSLL